MNNPRPQTVSDTFPSKWIHADDLNDRTHVLTISQAEVALFPSNPANFNSDKVWKPVLSFQKAEKQLILNKTQATAVAEIVGSEVYADWVGRRITLRPAIARNGKPTIAIAPPPIEKAPTSQATAAPVNELNATPRPNWNEPATAVGQRAVGQRAVATSYQIGDEVMVHGELEERLGVVVGFVDDLFIVSIGGRDFKLTASRLSLVSDEEE